MNIVYGPYTRKDGRKHVIIYNKETQKRTTQSYPRYLMEQKLGRKLNDNEEVDHIDDDPTNDNPDNLQVLTIGSHIWKTLRSRKSVAQYLELVCIGCNDKFYRREFEERHNREHLQKAGPFCSKSCAGYYGAQKQNGRI